MIHMMYHHYLSCMIIMSYYVNVYIYIYIPAPSNRSPLEAFTDLKVAGGNLLEGAGMFFDHIQHAESF